jgi:ubiquinone/menaquinone biosynthesis C-methylase UbiE
VGTGTGRDSLKMIQRRGDVYLLDYSWESLRLALSSMKQDRGKLVMADARHCPFESEVFDIVFHQGLLEHFDSPYVLLRENYRVLKRGGLLVVDVPQTFHIYTILKHILMFLGIWFGGWERQFTITSLSDLLKKFEFQPIHCYGDWSRPGIFYKILREIMKKFGVTLPMYPKFLGTLTDRFYNLQNRLRKKRLFLYTVLSIGIIAKKT